MAAQLAAFHEQCANSLYLCRQHIYDDLRPYMCLDLSCPHSSGPFSSLHAWRAHLELDHGMGPDWKSISCVLCSEATGQGKRAITRHLATHLEEISLSALPSGVDPESESAAAATDTDEDYGEALSEEECLEAGGSTSVDDPVKPTSQEPDNGPDEYIDDSHTFFCPYRIRNPARFHSGDYPLCGQHFFTFSSLKYVY